MLKEILRISRACRTLSVLAVMMSGLAARADIFVSTGKPQFIYPFNLGGQVLSYSEITGAPKLTLDVNQCCNGSTTGVAIGPDGNLYVADFNNHEVLGFDPSSGLPTGVSIPLPATSGPEGITFGPGGSLYVADSNNQDILRFDGPPSFTPTGTFSCTPPDAFNTCDPFDLTFGPDGNLYVSDIGSNQVVQLNGSSLAVIGVFVPSGVLTPGGLHFGSNENLYVQFFVPELDCLFCYYNTIYEYYGPKSGSPGAQVSSFAIAYDVGSFDFGFGPDGGLIVPSAYEFYKFNPSTAAWIGTFGYTGLWYVFSAGTGGGLMTIGGPCICNVVAYPPIHLVPTQNLRLTVIEGPVWVGPGVPVQVQLGFQNSQGEAIGPSQVVTLNPGQTASLDLVASTLITSGWIEVQPVVTAPPGAPSPMGSINGSAEVYNATSGFGSAFYPGVPVSGGRPVAGPPSLLPQGVALGQSIQINAQAPSDSPCVALLSFTDDTGNPIGPSQQVNLSPGQMASLTFNPQKYTESGRQEYVPRIRPNNPTGGQGVAPACVGSAEVYVTKTGVTSTYQTSSPAVGTMTPPAP